MISARLAVLSYIWHWSLCQTKRQIILIEENISKNADAGKQKGQVFYALVVEVDGFECRSVLFLLGGYLVSASIIHFKEHLMLCIEDILKENFSHLQDVRGLWFFMKTTGR